MYLRKAPSTRELDQPSLVGLVLGQNDCEVLEIGLDINIHHDDLIVSTTCIDDNLECFSIQIVVDLRVEIY